MSSHSQEMTYSTGYQAFAPEVQARWKEAQVQTIRNTVGRELSVPEFQMGMAIAAKYDLDPLLNEIWFAKDTNKNRVMIMTGRDGFLTVARRQPEYEGMAHDVVREKDEFSVSWEDGIPKVAHKYTGVEDQRGAILGAWAIAYFKGKKPTYFFAAKSEYMPTNEAKLKYSPWGSQLSVMMLKCAQSYVLRIGSGVSGLVGDEESARAMETAIDVSEAGEVITSGRRLTPEVEAVIARATDLEHPSWPYRPTWEMWMDLGEDFVASKVAEATEELDKWAKAPKIPDVDLVDAEVVEPDVPIDTEGLPPAQAFKVAAEAAVKAGEASKPNPTPEEDPLVGIADPVPAKPEAPPDVAPPKPDPEINVEALKRRFADLEKKRPRKESDKELRVEEMEWIKTKLAEAGVQIEENPEQETLV